ncbi:ABC transporter substrate-binding protein [Muricoccus radiodurans]|uniref:ABC transporter substrate-binding protein n=1 Tax=Muricoccus radiodurans TaxID=2231721 RepID=UPI003CF945DB
MNAVSRRAVLAGLGAAALARPATAQDARRTLRVAISGDLASLDPVWTTAVQTRYHAFLVYDTLFGIDAENRPQPQMIGRHEASADGLSHDFTLRDGLSFHDGSPVTAEDVVASWRRWETRDAAGQMVARFLDSLRADGPRTVRARLKEPFGGLIPALAKASAMPLYVMPARLAATPPTEQVRDATGSGPFIFQPRERVAGDRSVYLRNPHYVPRDEPASGLAGGKRVNVDRLEWVVLPDSSAAVAALTAGEIDMLEAVPYDIVPRLRRARGVTVEMRPGGNLGTLRLNHLNPPFDKPEARRALQLLVNQRDILDAVVGEMGGGTECGSLTGCSFPETRVEMGTELVLSRDPMEVRIRRAAEMFRAAGYDGRPIVMLHPTDQPIQGPPTLVLADAMRRAGLNPEIRSSDWAGIVSARVSKEQGPRGWHLFFNIGGSLLAANPAYHIQMSAACENSWFGWPCDAEMERLRFDWVRETDPAKQRTLLEAIQRRGMEITTFIPYGTFPMPTAFRDSVEGIVRVPETMVFWNITKRA